MQHIELDKYIIYYLKLEKKIKKIISLLILNLKEPLYFKKYELFF